MLIYKSCSHQLVFNSIEEYRAYFVKHTHFSLWNSKTNIVKFQGKRVCNFLTDHWLVGKDREYSIIINGHISVFDVDKNPINRDLLIESY